MSGSWPVRAGPRTRESPAKRLIARRPPMRAARRQSPRGSRRSRWRARIGRDVDGSADVSSRGSSCIHLIPGNGHWTQPRGPTVRPSACEQIRSPSSVDAASRRPLDTVRGRMPRPQHAARASTGLVTGLRRRIDRSSVAVKRHAGCAHRGRTLPSLGRRAARGRADPSGARYTVRRVYRARI